LSRNGRGKSKKAPVAGDFGVRGEEVSGGVWPPPERVVGGGGGKRTFSKIEVGKGPPESRIWGRKLGSNSRRGAAFHYPEGKTEGGKR